jgi:hypothetical protein
MIQWIRNGIPMAVVLKYQVVKISAENKKGGTYGN